MIYSTLTRKKFLQEKLFLLLISAFLFSDTVFSQQFTGRQIKDTYTINSTGGTTPGLTWLPLTYNQDGGKTYPLIIFLHGVGESQTAPGSSVYDGLTHTGLPQLIADGFNVEATNPIDGQLYKFIVVSPQHVWFSYGYPELEYILSSVKSKYRIDNTRIYVTGLSAGAQGTVAAVTNTESFASQIAAIVPISFTGYNTTTEQNNVFKIGGTYGVKMWAAVGQFDGQADANNKTKTLVANYNNAVPAPSTPALFNEIPGVGHDPGCWNTLYSPNWKTNSLNTTGKSIYEWMLQYSRNGNISPGANAGNDQTIILPQNSVTLNGSGADQDGTIASYQWSKFSGPSAGTINSPSSASTTVTGLVQGTYVFTLTVTDNLGAVGTDNVTVTVSPSVTLPARIEAENWVAMNGVGTEGAWGDPDGGNLVVGWIDPGDWLDYIINVPAAGTYAMNLRVASPNTGAQIQIQNASGTVLQTVSVPNTGGWQTWTTIPSSVTLPQGQQTIRLYSSTSVGWNINWFEMLNQVPTANAGTDIPITLPTNSVTLTGSGSDPDGTIASYQWSQLSGPAQGSITNPTSASTSVIGLVAGTYVFRLTVTDNLGATGSDDVTVTVSSNGSGTNRIEAENWTAMSGVSTENAWGDPDGGGLNVGWIDQGDWMEYSINPPVAGTYGLRLRIATPNSYAGFDILKQDGSLLLHVDVPTTGGWQTWQTISYPVTLSQGPQTIKLLATTPAGWNINWLEFVSNFAPTVNAGPDQNLPYSTSSTTLNGSASDQDGTVVSYSWTQTSGTSATISSPTSASTNITGLAPGNYTFRLTATDNASATAFDDVTITVAQPTVTIPARIQSENWTAMSGVSTENAWGDPDGGGLNVGWVDQGDWMEYNINVPTAGSYGLQLRIATPNSYAGFDILKQDGSLLLHVDVPTTGGWQTWQTINFSVTLPQGQQTIKFLATTSAGWNINWFEFSPVNGGITLRNPQRFRELKSVGLQVSPNPINDRFTLSVDNPYTGQMKVEVVDMSGNLVRVFFVRKEKAGALSSNLLLGNMARGQYLLKLSMKNWNQSIKLIKQ